ncbi:MAG: hypothetical protein HGA39_00285 [Coriobacteriia bacterium]|nr:hypothetical protein [Coriobacteriia bacterium]
MLVPFGQDAGRLQIARAVHELESCNTTIECYGLSLSSADIQALVVGRLEALRESERVEFGGGVTKALVLAFAGSPHVSQSTFAQQILELQDLFYEFKNESLEQVPDDELIGKIRSLFDDVAEGDMECLAEALFDGLGRHIREEALGEPDTAHPEADNAAANAYTLAAHRYDVSKWVDDTYAPAWEGASWLDE